jgi:WD domain, G-beta repeat
MTTISPRNRTVGRTTPSNYRTLHIRATPYPFSAPNSPTRAPSPTRRFRTPSPLKPRRSTPDRFIVRPSSPISLRHILSSQGPKRDRSQSPTNPKLEGPGGREEWPNSQDETLLSYRLASALEIPLSSRLLHFSSRPTSPVGGTGDPAHLVRQYLARRTVSPEAYRVLDAPELRDDYYAQPLSWSPRGDLAVCLADRVYIWEESRVRGLHLDAGEEVTCVRFDSTGEVLAIGLERGGVLLQGPKDKAPRVRIEAVSPGTVGALAWSPVPVVDSPEILTEILTIGTVDGVILLLIVEWQRQGTRAKVNNLISRWDTIHTDQICGIAWSKDGLSFATGANDNKVVTYQVPLGQTHKFEKRFEWAHDAAIKGLAFKSGKGSILAVGPPLPKAHLT